MKRLISSVLKPVLTVLIAVLIPVLMLTGCEKTPADTAGDSSSENQSSTDGFVFRNAYLDPTLSAEEMTAIVQEYLWPLQFFECSFLYPDSISYGYSFVKFGAWTGYGVSFGTKEVNDFYGVPRRKTTPN